MAMSSTIPTLDWLVGFQRNVYRIGKIGNWDGILMIWDGI